MPDKKTELAKYVDRLIRDGEFATKGAVAKAIEMTDAGLSRVVNDGGRLTVEQCLRLALVLKEDPVQILCVADRQDIAGVFAQLSHREETVLSPPELEILNLWRTAAPPDQRTVKNVLLMANTARAVIAHSGSVHQALRKEAARMVAIDRAHKARRPKKRRKRS